MWEGLGTGILSAVGGWLSQEKTDERVQKQMDFQERMSSTAYQRAMADMKLAGLNPMLAYSQGGASSPAGSAPAASDILTPAISTAQQAKRIDAEVDNMKKTNRLIDEQTETQKTTQAQQGAAAAASLASAKQMAAETAILSQELSGAQREALKAEHDEKVYATPGGKVLRTLGTIMREIGIGGNSARSRITVHPRPGN